MATANALNAVVIGGGVGGLSAAIALASQGCSVTLVEAAPALGGKAGESEYDGVSFDTGPSLVTLLGVIERLFKLSGSRLEDELKLIEHPIPFRYHFPDGVALDVHHELPATLEAIKGTLGQRAQDEFAAFMGYAATIWESSSDNFVFGDSPTIKGLFTTHRHALFQIGKIDPMRAMWSAICSKISHPHLRTLLARYATYNGSDVRKAPATLNCIAHVELAMGGYGIEGGLYALVAAMVRRAQALGVNLRTNAPVEEVLVRSGQATGVKLRGGEHLEAQLVVSNAEARHLETALLTEGSGQKASSRSHTSMSAYNVVLKARAQEGTVVRPHTVIFPRDYLNEFKAIFDEQRPPTIPTIYACDQALTHHRPRWEDGTSPLFAMINAPSTDASRGTLSEDEAASLVRVATESVGLTSPGDPIVWARSPVGLADRFPGSYGGLYGAASNSPWAAFSRPSNRHPRVRGLYLATGTAHPGGGVPLCISSGLIAARHALADQRRDTSALTLEGLSSR